MFSPLLTGKVKNLAREVVIGMWWIDIVVVVLMALAVYGFLTIVGFNTRRLTRKTDRRAEDMYDSYADPPRRRHRGS
jgi:type II secretory pathway component PulL